MIKIEEKLLNKFFRSFVLTNNELNIRDDPSTHSLTQCNETIIFILPPLLIVRQSLWNFEVYDVSHVFSR